MKYCSVPINWFKISVYGWNLHIVENRMKEGLTATDADIGAFRRDHGVRGGNDRLGRRHRGSRIDWQTLALVCVEQREALEEGNAEDHISGLSSALAHRLGREAIGIDDRDAPFALANVPSHGQGLVEREPIVPREFSLGDGRPKRKDIDPRIGSKRRCIA